MAKNPKRKRKRCMSCKKSEVVRYSDNKGFPMGCFCSLENDVKLDSPWDALHSCDHSCEHWEGK